MAMNANQRSFFRLQFAHPLGAEVKVIGLEDVMPDQKQTPAALIDLSAGGSRFFTASPLPSEPHALLELRFTAFGVVYRPLGIVVRSILPEEDHYEYCVQFSLDEPDTAAMTSMLNQMAIKLRKSPTLANCSFCTPQELALFKPLQSRTT